VAFKQTSITIGFLVLLAYSSAAQNCQLANRPAPGWSEQLRKLMPDCDNRVSSPDGKLIFQIGADQKIRILNEGRSLALDGNLDLEPPAVISWSPRSDVFFLNDGQGSGLSSQLRLFYVFGPRAVENGRVNRSISDAFRQEDECEKSAEPPNVWGLGWSEDGQKLYVMAQTIVGGICGNAERFRGYVVNAHTGAIERVLTTSQTRSRFRQLLPENMR
jgi:hypothetical protein